MAHFAELDDNNIVLQVIVVNNETVENKSFPESEPIGIAFCRSLYGQNTFWKQTSYNNTFRKHYAGIGYRYDVDLDAFIPPKPYPSWLLNTDTANWEPPVPYPNDGKVYSWVEATQSWILVEPQPVDVPVV